MKFWCVCFTLSLSFPIFSNQITYDRRHKTHWTSENITRSCREKNVRNIEKKNVFFFLLLRSSSLQRTRYFKFQSRVPLGIILNNEPLYNLFSRNNNRKVKRDSLNGPSWCGSPKVSIFKKVNGCPLDSIGSYNWNRTTNKSILFTSNSALSIPLFQYNIGWKGNLLFHLNLVWLKFEILKSDWNYTRKLLFHNILEQGTDVNSH